MNLPATHPPYLSGKGPGVGVKGGQREAAAAAEVSAPIHGGPEAGAARGAPVGADRWSACSHRCGGKLRPHPLTVLQWLTKGTLCWNSKRHSVYFRKGAASLRLLQGRAFQDPGLSGMRLCPFFSSVYCLTGPNPFPGSETLDATPAPPPPESSPSLSPNAGKLYPQHHSQGCPCSGPRSPAAEGNDSVQSTCKPLAASDSHLPSCIAGAFTSL